MTMKILQFVLWVFWGSLLQVHALIPTHNKQRLIEHWEFIRQDMGSIWEVMRPVLKEGSPEAVPLWQTITLPHCFNAEDAVDPDVNYYQGIGWYRTMLCIDNPYKDGRVYLEFEGAGQKTDVYVYTTHVASHVGGYDEWKVDITESVRAFYSDTKALERFHGKVPIAIRCDNSRDTELIPSDMSDFNLYGGLYRYVNLVYTPAFQIEKIQIDATTDTEGQIGDVKIGVQLTGKKAEKLELQISSSDGEEVGRESFEISDSSKLVTCRFNVKWPKLWSPKSPQLYTCIVKLVGQGDTLCAIDRFGFRSFQFTEKGPFYLNGKRLLLRGTHRHEDHAGVGAALTEEMMRTEMLQIKDMGANFIRLGHYQQSNIILRLCDELGLLVWEEIPWCRGGLGGEPYREQARRMLTNMITQHRNHPSIILWGLGNENDWPGDFPIFSKDSIRAFMSELNNLAHRLDPSRLTVIRRCDFCKDLVDVYSPSIWAGWYSRRFQDYRQMELTGIASTSRFIHAEWGGDSHAGRHAEDRKKDGHSSFDIEAGDRYGDWSESYIVRLFDWHLKEQEKMDELTGTAFWAFKDFSTPLRPNNPIPYVNQKGVVQRDGTPKESYYVFQSYWSEKPMLHIYGHSWPMRWGKNGEKKEVLVYSNCAEVELFVNGVSQGRKKRSSKDFPAAGLHWNVVLKPGKNQLKAVGRYGNELLCDTISQDYETRAWGKPSHLRLTSEVVTDGKFVLLQAELVDCKGVRCLDASLFVRFGCTNPLALLGNQGTAQGSIRIQLANGLAKIRIQKSRSPVVVSVSDESGLIPVAFLTIK